MNDSTIDLDDYNNQQKRPVFITVLGILTFVGSGIWILGGLFSLLKANQMEAFEAIRSSPFSRNSNNLGYDDYIKWMMYSNIVNIVTGVLGLVGGLMMFQLKKVGYYLYSLSWIGFMVFTFVMVNAILAPFLGGFAYSSVALYFIIMAAFLIMYGVNLKHMK